MVQKLILFYLSFELKFFILKLVTMILKIIHFSPKFCNFFLCVYKFVKKFYYTLIMVGLVCKLRRTKKRIC